MPGREDRFSPENGLPVLHHVLLMSMLVHMGVMKCSIVFCKSDMFPFLLYMWKIPEINHMNHTPVLCCDECSRVLNRSLQQNQNGEAVVCAG